MRPYLAYCPDEEPRIFACWILSLGEPRVMVPFVFFLRLLLSWVLLGMGRKKVGFGYPSPLLRMMTGLVQHFRSAILDAWRF